ncbi:hypothetical protein M422DRAFT_239013 [Sphaerobolus stellatus SS14]|nr:hypothetical protein M422DRAFT_239013 [Sphaerobolus stellatus SS14]
MNGYIATFATVQTTGMPDATTSNQALREANIGTFSYTSIGYKQEYWTSGSEARDYFCGRSNYSPSGAQTLLCHYVLKNMQSIKHFLDCPEEIVEYFDIKSEANLLHFALTCKVLSSRIIPYHIQFRALRINLLERFPNRFPKL